MVATRADAGTSVGSTRAGDVYQKLHDAIIACDLVPGDNLRFEALKDRYGVSYSTLREALSRLEAQMLVVSEGHRGYRVAPVSIADLQDLTDTRVLIECEALRRSIAYGDDAWEAAILAAFYRMDRLQKRLGKQYYLSADWAEVHGEFHRALVMACRSPTMLRLRRALFERAHRYRRMSSQFRTKWRPKDVEHKSIMDAALDRDTDKALRLTESHIRETTNNVLRYAGHLFQDHANDPTTATAVSGPTASRSAPTPSRSRPPARRGSARSPRA
ncbi:MAG: FCD domain-containing protein [Burkholderiaceae bacterium]